MANGDLTNIILTLQNYGVLEIMLPFFLVFTIVFAVLQRVKIFGDDKKTINIIMALVMGILTVVPHVTGNYPGKYDPVVIINTLLPSVGVLSVVIILLLFLWGMFGGEWAGGSVPSIIIGIMVLILGYIFGATVGWWDDPSQIFRWWGSDLTTLIIVIVVFGLIIMFITGGEKKTPGESMFKGLKELFKGRS